MKKRIIGIDVARAFAVIGMVLVNFKMVLGQQGESWIKHFSSLLEGKAAATFVVLAGVGIAFMTNTAISKNNFDKIKIAKKRPKSDSIVVTLSGRGDKDVEVVEEYLKKHVKNKK